MLTKEFKDVEIKELDEKETHNPNPSKQIYSVYFTLTSSPPPEWIALFNESRRFVRHSRWRRMHIEGTWLVIACPLEEAQFQVDDAKQDITSANRQYRDQLALSAEAARQRAQQDQDEQDRIRKLKDSLKLS